MLAAGVDPTGIGGALAGYGDQRNYELLIEAGFTPARAVQIMTLNGARILGVDKQLGSVEKGKMADLVVLKGDLAADPDRHPQHDDGLQGRSRLRLGQAHRVGAGEGGNRLRYDSAPLDRFDAGQEVP